MTGDVAEREFSCPGEAEESIVELLGASEVS